MNSKKYRQEVIPNVTEGQFSGMKMGALKKYVKSYYIANFKGKTITNKHRGIKVQFSTKGISHLLYARNAGYIKLKAVTVLDEMIERAVLLNFKEHDSDDSEDILGYFNFKVKVRVEGLIQYFRIVIRLTKNGKFYYDHSVKVRK